MRDDTEQSLHPLPVLPDDPGMEIEDYMRAGLCRPVDLACEYLSEQRRTKLTVGARFDVPARPNSLFELVSVDEWPSERHAHHALNCDVAASLTHA
jgi:hypothetical protein